ncbi:MAG: hypothetical protein ACREQJ_13325 [Candidatus Binatia bacterium]
MQIKKSLLLGMATLALGGFLTACERQEGPAEEAGEAIDQGTRDAGQAAGQAMEQMGDQMEDAGEAAQGQQ